jgi:hypothetical protein
MLKIIVINLKRIFLNHFVISYRLKKYNEEKLSKSQNIILIVNYIFVYIFTTI